MEALLAFSRAVDWVTGRLGKLVTWCVLIAVLISAANASVRYLFDTSSNAWLEIQWYLFSAVFMLGVGYVMLKNAHVRIDFISARLSARGRNWVDIIGIVAFLAPLCLLLLTLSWPLFVNAWTSGEMSQNAGGLIRWPVQLMIPLGMVLLLAQAGSELIKRIAFLKGLIPDPLAHAEPGKAHGEQAASEAGATK